MDKNKMMRDSISGKTFNDLNYEQGRWLIDSGVHFVLNGPSCYQSAAMQLLDFDIGMNSKKICGVNGASVGYGVNGEPYGCFIATTIVLDWKIYFEDDFDPNDLAGNMLTGRTTPVGYPNFARMKEFYESKIGQDFLATKTIHWQR